MQTNRNCIFLKWKRLLQWLLIIKTSVREDMDFGSIDYKEESISLGYLIDWVLDEVFDPAENCLPIIGTSKEIYGMEWG
jgi:hypothetical protein